MSVSSQPLQGVTVLVTRPEHQADEFCKLVEAAGGKAIRFPVIAIEEIIPDETTLQKLQQPVDKLIFISANAVRIGIPVLEQQAPACLEKSEIIAIGEATARKLLEVGYPPHTVPPSPFNSEALLAMPEMQPVKGQHIVLIKGKGGRTYLAEQLHLRAAQVTEADNYERVKPNISNEPLNAFRRASKPVVAVTSVKGLHYLLEMADESQEKFLRTRTRFLVPGERVAEAVKDLHIRHAPLVAENATDKVMLETLLSGWA